MNLINGRELKVKYIIKENANMKKIRKLATKLLIATMVLTSCMSVTVYGMTAKDVTAKTPKSCSWNQQYIWSKVITSST